MRYRCTRTSIIENEPFPQGKGKMHQTQYAISKDPKAIHNRIGEENCGANKSDAQQEERSASSYVTKGDNHRKEAEGAGV